MLAIKLPPGHAGPLEGKDPWPLKFFRHSFGARCYNTLACSMVYNGHQFGTRRYDRGRLVDQPKGPPASHDWKRNWYAPHGIRPGNATDPAFPTPLDMEWTSRDGELHTFSLDLNRIFPDRLILHCCNRDELVEEWIEICAVKPVVPEILVELNDRTVMVYMRALLFSKTEALCDNRKSRLRNEIITAWHHEF